MEKPDTWCLHLSATDPWYRIAAEPVALCGTCARAATWLLRAGCRECGQPITGLMTLTVTEEGLGTALSVRCQACAPEEADVVIPPSLEVIR